MKFRFRRNKNEKETICFYLRIEPEESKVRTVIVDRRVNRIRMNASISARSLETPGDEIHYTTLALYHGLNCLSLGIRPTNRIELYSNSKIFYKVVKKILKGRLLPSRLEVHVMKLRNVLTMLEDQSKIIEIKFRIPWQVEDFLSCSQYVE